MIRRMLIASLLGLSLFAGTSEACFGSYASKAVKVPVKFRLEDKGISSFEAFGRSYDPKGVAVDFLGTYGNSEILQIKFSSAKDHESVIKLFAVVVDGSVKLVTGYLIDFELNSDNSMKIHKLVPLEFRFIQQKQ